MRTQEETTQDEADEIAEMIGYPLVVKVNSSNIPRKTEAGAVILGVKDKPDLVRAYGSVLANAREHHPNAQISGVLIQEMMDSGTEVVLEVINDPQFATIILSSLGGVFHEVLKDISFRGAPVSRIDAEEMIREIRSFDILQADPRPDLEAVIDIILRLSQLFLELEEGVKKVTIDPLLVFKEGRGAKAVDFSVVMH